MLLKQYKSVENVETRSCCARELQNGRLRWGLTKCISGLSYHSIVELLLILIERKKVREISCSSNFRMCELEFERNVRGLLVNKFKFF